MGKELLCRGMDRQTNDIVHVTWRGDAVVLNTCVENAERKFYQTSANAASADCAGCVSASSCSVPPGTLFGLAYVPKSDRGHLTPSERNTQRRLDFGLLGTREKERRDKLRSEKRLQRQALRKPTREKPATALKKAAALEKKRLAQEAAAARKLETAKKKKPGCLHPKPKSPASISAGHKKHKAEELASGEVAAHNANAKTASENSDDAVATTDDASTKKRSTDNARKLQVLRSGSGTTQLDAALQTKRHLINDCDTNLDMQTRTKQPPPSVSRAKQQKKTHVIHSRSDDDHEDDDEPDRKTESESETEEVGSSSKNILGHRSRKQTERLEAVEVSMEDEPEKMENSSAKSIHHNRKPLNAGDGVAKATRSPKRKSHGAASPPFKADQHDDDVVVKKCRTTSFGSKMNIHRLSASERAELAEAHRQVEENDEDEQGADEDEGDDSNADHEDARSGCEEEGNDDEEDSENDLDDEGIDKRIKVVDEEDTNDAVLVDPEEEAEAELESRTKDGEDEDELVPPDDEIAPDEDDIPSDEQDDDEEDDEDDDEAEHYDEDTGAFVNDLVEDLGGVGDDLDDTHEAEDIWY